jgi:hypothetical protein
VLKSDLWGRSRDDHNESATQVGFKSDFASRDAYNRKHTRLLWASMHELGG